MLSRSEKQKLSGPPTDIYGDLETLLMKNIIRHVQSYDQLIDSDTWLLQKLAEIGKLNTENIKIIAESAGLSRTAVERMLNETADLVMERIEPGFSTLERQGVIDGAIPVKKSENVEKAVKMVQRQAFDSLNVCNTTMLYKARDAYKKLVQDTVEQAKEITNKQEFLDIMGKHATAQAIGVESRQQAIRSTIKEFNEKGIPGFVDRSGREWTPEAYVAMTLRTTAGNTATEAMMARMEDRGISLIQMSSHPGARPKCAKDQGKIFDLNNGRGMTKDLHGKEVPYYPLRESSYGEPDGILGINCGHHGTPFIPGISTQRYFPTKDFEENDELYKKLQIQRGIERNIRKQKRLCMLYDEAGDTEAFELAAVKLKSKEAQMNAYIKGNKELLRRKDREQVIGFDKGVSAQAVASKKRVAKTANSMYDTGSEEGNIKAYYRDKSLREQIQSSAVKKELEPGQYKKHVPGTNEFKQYQVKYQKAGQYGPSYLTIDEQETQELVNEYAGTGILKRDKNGKWLNEEIITVQPKEIGNAVNNLTGKEAATTVFKIKYGKNGTHVIPDYPSKKGMKGK